MRRDLEGHEDQSLRNDPGVWRGVRSQEGAEDRSACYSNSKAGVRRPLSIYRLNSEISISVSTEDEGIRSQTSGCFHSRSSCGKQSGMGAYRIQELQGEGGAPMVWKVGRDALGLRELFGSLGDVLA